MNYSGLPRAGRHIRARIVAVLAPAIMVAAVTVTPAGAAVSSVSGGAFGFKTAVSLFGGPTMVRGDAAGDAVVSLPSGGSVVPVTDYAAAGAGVYGPATIYTSGPLAVSTQGDVGDTIARPGYVASTATATNIGTWLGVMAEDAGYWNPALGGQMDPFIALKASSSCAISQTGAPVGTTTIVGGRVVDTDLAGNPVNERQVDVVPAANAMPMTGTLAHIGDNYEIYFNEQIVSPDGKSITVNAVHMKLLGPTAVGDMYIGQSRCAYTSP